MIATIKIDIEKESRAKVCELASETLGEYFTKLGKFDVSEFTKDEWDRMVNVAFDTIGIAALTGRIVVVPPAESDSFVGDQMIGEKAA